MIKIGIVGTGGMAHYHASTFKNIEGISIISACDVDKNRVTKFADKFDIKERYTSIDELLEKSNQLSTPVIDINGEIIVGFDEKLIESALNKASS